MATIHLGPVMTIQALYRAPYYLGQHVYTVADSRRMRELTWDASTSEGVARTIDQSQLYFSLVVKSSNSKETRTVEHPL